jgi:hypothetical protein
MSCIIEIDIRPTAPTSGQPKTGVSLTGKTIPSALGSLLAPSPAVIEHPMQSPSPEMNERYRALLFVTDRPELSDLLEGAHHRAGDLAAALRSVLTRKIERFPHQDKAKDKYERGRGLRLASMISRCNHTRADFTAPKASRDHGQECTEKAAVRGNSHRIRDVRPGSLEPGARSTCIFKGPGL